MEEELPEIQATIPEIRASLQQYVDSFSGSIQVRYILVPFNDPGTRSIVISNHQYGIVPLVQCINMLCYT